VTLDSRVAERCIFITAKCEYGLVHLLRIEHLELNQQVKVFDSQPGDNLEQLWLDFCDHVLQCVLPEIGQISTINGSSTPLNWSFTISQVPLPAPLFMATSAEYLDCLQSVV
jgi:hypothetical protein